MIVKQKTSPKPVYAESDKGVVQPLCCTPGGELLTHQVNNPDYWEDLVDLLQSIQLDPDGAVVVSDKDKTVNVEGVVKTEGKVKVDNIVTVNPVTVANMPDQIRIQEPLCITQKPAEAKVMPFSFNGYGCIVLPKPCKVYSIHLSVIASTYVEIVGITGEMWIKNEFKLDLFPRFIQLDELKIKAVEYVKGGGYVIYDS